MWGKKDKKSTISFQTLIGRETELKGDIYFKGGIHIDGHITGNVIAEGDSSSVLQLSENSGIEGEVRVPHITVNGTIKGDVYSSEHVELAAHARITGNVYYNLIEMAIGAEVNGKLVHQSESEDSSVVKFDIKEKQNSVDQ